VHLIGSKNDRYDDCPFFKILLQIAMRTDIYLDSDLTAHLQVPPPITHPHLIEYSVLAFRIFVSPFWGKTHLISERRVTDKLTYTLNRISLPQVQYFFAFLSLLIQLITFYFKRFAKPFRHTWEGINLFVEHLLVFE